MPLGPSGRGQWLTVLDFDLTANGSQTLNADQNWTIGGMQWNKQNSANDSVAMAITAGTGLVVQPNSTSDYNGATRSLPILWLPLSQIALLNDLDWDSSLRLWAHVSASNTNASFDNAVVSIDSGKAGALGYQLDRGVVTGPINGMAGQHIINSASITTGTFTAGNALTLGATNNVMVIDVPHILGGFAKFHFGTFGQGAPSWPDASTLIAHSMGLSSINSYNTFLVGSNTFAATPNQLMGIGLGAKRAGSATALSITYAHVRLDVRL